MLFEIVWKILNSELDEKKRFEIACKTWNDEFDKKMIFQIT